MQELSESSKRLVEGLRDARAPTDAVVSDGLARLRDELGAAVDAPGSGTGSGGGGGGGSGTSPGGGAGGSLALKLALGAVVSGATVAAFVFATGEPAGAEADGTTSIGDRVMLEDEPPGSERNEGDTPSGPQGAGAPADPVDPATPEPELTPEEPAAEPAQPAPEEPPARGAATRDEGSNLEEELRLVRSATAATAAGEHAQALKLLSEHARRFPRGALAGERELTRAKTLCASGEAVRARKIASRYLARHPNSHLASRFEQVCHE